MSAYPAQGPEGPRQPVSALPVGPEAVIRAFNGEDAHAELFESARHAADIVHRAHAESDRSCAVARKAHRAWRTAQLEHHDRRAWLPLMALTALIFLGLDLRAAYSAAVTLGGDQQ